MLDILKAAGRDTNLSPVTSSLRTFFILLFSTNLGAKVLKKLLIYSIFVQLILDKNRFFISFTIQMTNLHKKVVTLQSVKWSLKQLI